MKRYLILCLVLVLALGCLAGCAQQKPNEELPTDTQSEKPTLAGEPNNGEGETLPIDEQPVTPQVTLSSDGDLGMPPQSIVSSGDLIVPGSAYKLVVVVPDAFGDHGFADAAKAGADRLKSEYGVSAVTIECHGKDYEDQLRSAAANATAVVCIGSEFSVLKNVAPDFPEVHFIWVEGGEASPMDNVLQISFAQNEGGYLAGYLAAASSQSGRIGAVCAGNGTVAQDYLAGFRQGAAAFRSDVQVFTEEIAADGDAEAAHDAALSLCDQGADVIFQLAGSAGEGVFAAAQERGVYVIGAESDQKYLADSYVLASVVKAVDNAVHDSVLEAMQGKYEKWGGVWVASISGGYLRIGYGATGATELVPASLQSELDEVTLRIVSGEVTVETAR